MGSVVIKNSDLSLIRPRNAIAETGMFELKLKVPLKKPVALNGVWSRKRAVCACGASFNVPDPESVPFESVKKNEIVASDSFGLTIAKPVFTYGPIST